MHNSVILFFLAYFSGEFVHRNVRLPFGAEKETGKVSFKRILNQFLYIIVIYSFKL